MKVIEKLTTETIDYRLNTWCKTISKVCSKKLLVIILKLLLFEIVFIGVIISISVAMFAFLGLIYLNRDLPYRSGEESLLTLQPGLSMVPRPDSLTSLLRFRVGWKSTFINFQNDLFGFVQGYERYSIKSRLVDCDYDVPYRDHPKYSCIFSPEVGNIGCNLGSSYGFDETYPCIALKLNRILGWEPKFDYITANNTDNLKHGFPSVKIRCEGVHESDKEILKNKICYFDQESALRDPSTLSPEQDGGCSLEYGQIRNYYFPYKKQESYQIPFVWVKFLGLRQHIVVMVQCWAIADNIYVDFELGLGSVTFELLVD